MQDELINYLETSNMIQLTEAVNSLRMLGQRPDTKILTAVVCSLQNHCDAGDASAHDTIEVLRGDRKSTRLNSSHSGESRMPSSA